MPIPNQKDVGVGIPALVGSNEHLLASYTPNKLRSGTPIVFIDSSGTRINALMGYVRDDLSPVQITVSLVISGKRTEFSNIPYNDTPGNPAYTWRFPSDG